MASLWSVYYKISSIVKSLTIDFAVAFGSVFLATGLWYSFDKNNPKIDSILIPVIAVFIYRIFGRMFGNVIETIKRRNET
tara:strand:- start:647 stop:886 length:240 start_codon:yes stop_codon:yes gene_type:complete